MYGFFFFHIEEYWNIVYSISGIKFWQFLNNVGTRLTRNKVQHEILHGSKYITLIISKLFRVSGMLSEMMICKIFFDM